MQDRNIILNDLKSSIKCFKPLTIKEAQELYKKAIDTAEPSLKKNYMDKLILGTLHIVYDYIDKNHIDIFCSSTYDINDIIGATTEAWINKIYKGALLTVDQFSFLFNQSFFNAVYQNLGGPKIEPHTLFEIPAANFIELFANFIELKNKGISFTASDVTGDYFSSRYRYYSENENVSVKKFRKNKSQEIK